LTDYTKDEYIDQREVLDKGFVKFVSYEGDVYKILRAARISTGGVASKGEKQDKGLLRYLYKNQHLTPFEQISLTFDVKMPHSIAKQWLRHRGFSPNEYSLRYSEAIDEMYMPIVWRKQGEKNHQGSGEPFDYHQNMKISGIAEEAYDKCLIVYNYLISQGVAREQARFVLPLANYTMLTFTTDLRNLLHFLELRLHSHAQHEIRVYAEAIHDMLKCVDDFGWIIEIFDEFNSLGNLYHDAINKETNTEKLKKLLYDFTQGTE